MEKRQNKRHENMDMIQNPKLNVTITKYNNENLGANIQHYHKIFKK